MRSMVKKNKRIKFYFTLVIICCFYWGIDSIWSFVSFEKNLQVLIYSEPSSLIDTLALRVPPYQLVSRLIVITLFLVSGALLYEFLLKKRMAELAFKESEEKYRILVSHASDAIYISQDGTITFSNPRTVSLTGYEEQELAGLPFDKLVHPDFKALVEEKEKERKINESLPITYSFQILRKNSHPLWVQLSTTLIQWEGRPATLNFLRDISKEKRLAEELQRAEKMEALGTLAGGVAHDLNNILSGLVSYPELLLLDLPKESPLRNPILTMQASGKKAALVVQDLLTLARRGVVGKEVINLNEVINEYLDSPEFTELQVVYSNIQTHRELDPEILNIIGSSIHLSKTVMNLISNAFEASSNGGLITISTRSEYVDIPVEGYDNAKEGDYVVLEVRDTGEGISPDDLKRIFEPFYTKKVMGRSGTGLGMAVVWSTVKDHQGYIDLKSSLNNGTVVKLYFPATRKEVLGKSEEVSMEDIKGNGENILIVDDIEEQRLIASSLLSRLGYSVQTVSSGENAISYLAAHSADLVILDMIMDPGMDGLDTYKKILEINPTQKALIASGFSESNRVKKAQTLGAGAYINKPYTLETIGTSVKAELER